MRLLPVSDEFRPYCEKALAELTAAGVRAEIDQGGRSIGKQIKIANTDKVPILAVVGAPSSRGDARHTPLATLGHARARQPASCLLDPRRQLPVGLPRGPREALLARRHSSPPLSAWLAGSASRAEPACGARVRSPREEPAC